MCLEQAIATLPALPALPVAPALKHLGMPFELRAAALAREEAS